MTNKANPPIAALSGLNLPQPLLTFLNQLWLRTGGNVDVISDIEVQQTAEDGGNRTYRRYRDEIDELTGLIAEQKRYSRSLEQQVLDLIDVVHQAKTRNRLLEQQINEIIERIDIGV